MCVCVQDAFRGDVFVAGCGKKMWFSSEGSMENRWMGGGKRGVPVNCREMTVQLRVCDHCDSRSRSC